MPESIELAVAWAIVIGTLGTVATIFTLVRARARAANPPAAVDREEMAHLRENLQRLASEVSDLQERVDFAERLLARNRDAERLKG